ncbi:hypothetical protein IFM89_035592, partial [Coptis chinensis]
MRPPKQRKPKASKPQTPLWEYIEKLEKQDGGGNNRCRCKFCKLEFNGSYTRVRGHLLHIPRYGIEICEVVDSETLKKLFKIQADADAKATAVDMQSIPLPNVENYGLVKRNGDGGLGELFNMPARDKLDHLIARAFFGCAIANNVLRSPLFREAIQFACDNNLVGYIPPTADRLRTVLLQQEREHIERRNGCFERLFPNIDDKKKVKEEYGRFSGCLGGFADWESQNDRYTEDASAWWNNYGSTAPALAILAD